LARSTDLECEKCSQTRASNFVADAQIAGLKAPELAPVLATLDLMPSGPFRACRRPATSAAGPS
jgi:hypothetical protein